LGVARSTDIDTWKKLKKLTSAEQIKLIIKLNYCMSYGLLD